MGHLPGTTRAVRLDATLQDCGRRGCRSRQPTNMVRAFPHRGNGGGAKRLSSGRRLCASRAAAAISGIAGKIDATSQTFPALQADW
jgi:hypothetical protein